MNMNFGQQTFSVNNVTHESVLLTFCFHCMSLLEQSNFASEGCTGNILALPKIALHMQGLGAVLKSFLHMKCSKVHGAQP